MPLNQWCLPGAPPSGLYPSPLHSSVMREWYGCIIIMSLLLPCKGLNCCCCTVGIAGQIILSSPPLVSPSYSCTLADSSLEREGHAAQFCCQPKSIQFPFCLVIEWCPPFLCVVVSTWLRGHVIIAQALLNL